MNLSERFIRRPVMTVALTVSVILFGIFAYLRLPVSDLPAIDYPVIQVQVSYPGATPDTMANNVATPLERQFMQIPGLELVTSNNLQGHTSFVLQFDLSKSLDGAATDVQAAITRAQAQLPLDLPSPPTFTKTNPNDQPIMYIPLVSDTATEGQLYDYANTQVGERISILPGVSQVSVFGARSAIRIRADPSAMAVRNTTLDDLTAAIKNGTNYTGAGQFDGPNRSFLLQPQGQLTTADEYNNLIIGQTNGAPVFLKDVASATQGVQDERIDMRFWVRGHPEPHATVVVAVFRRAGVNAALCFRCWYALRSMHTAFVFQFGVDLVALNRGHDFFEPAERRRRAFQNFHLPVLCFRVARIHAKKFTGKKRGFVAAGPGADFHDDALVVVRIFRQQ